MSTEECLHPVSSRSVLVDRPVDAEGAGAVKVRGERGVHDSRGCKNATVAS